MDTVATVAGKKRSGSTWMFNVVRCAYELTGRDVWAGGPKPEGMSAIRKGEHDVFVVKEHRWFPDLAARSDLIFTSNRRDAQVRRSMKDFRGWTPDNSTLREWNNRLARWREKSDYHMAYPDLVRSPRAECEQIVSAIGLDVWVPSLMDRVADAMQPPENKRQDPDSLVFADHYTSRDPDQIAESHKSAFER